MDQIRNDIYTNGSYYHNNPTFHIEDSYWKASMIFDIMKRNNIKRDIITEVGCGAGGILEQLAIKDASIKKLFGFDISPQAITLAKTRENDRIRFLNDDFLTYKTEISDVLLLIDIIEHIEDFYGFLKQLRTKSSSYIFHIPLDISCRTLLKPHIMLQQRELVGHIHYFSKELVFWALRDTGYEIIDWTFTKPMIDIKPAKTLRHLMKKTLRKVSFSLNADLSAKLWGGYSMLIVAK